MADLTRSQLVSGTQGIFFQKRVRRLFWSGSDAFDGSCPKVPESARIGDFANGVNFISACVVSGIGSCHQKGQSDFEKPSVEEKTRFLAQILDMSGIF